MDNSLPNLPIGQSSFPDIRQDGQTIYVDKTSLVYELARAKRRIFLSRPRRFGKSLLVSTFESLFRFGLRDFKGLAIEPLWNDGTYLTLSLNFAAMRDARNGQEFNLLFARELNRAFRKTDLPEIFDENSNPAERFGMFLDDTSKAGQQIVLLIDEYDSPLNGKINQPELFDEILTALDRFYTQVKNGDAAIRFLFMTGIAKFGKTSIFSMLNHVTDISQMKLYGSLLGYTEAEIRKNLTAHLERASSVCQLPVDAVMDRMRLRYDGFCFDGSACTHVFNPWSVLNFLQNPEEGFANYWYESSGRPAVLLEYLRSHPIARSLDLEGPFWSFKSSLTLTTDLGGLTPLALLFRTGYLSIAGVAGDGWDLKYPNREVSESIQHLFKELVFVHPEELSSCRRELIGAFTDRDAKSFVDILQKAVSQIAYDNYPITNEAGVRMAIQQLLIGAGFGPSVEVHTPHGRTDLQFTYGGIRWLLELKFVREGESAQAKLQEAISQIRDRRYGEDMDPDHRVRLALVFEDRRFTAWSTVE